MKQLLEANNKNALLRNFILPMNRLQNLLLLKSAKQKMDVNSLKGKILELK